MCTSFLSFAHKASSAVENAAFLRAVLNSGFFIFDFQSVEAKKGTKIVPIEIVFEGAATSLRRPSDQYFYLFFQLNGCQTSSLTVLHHERFRPSDLLASWERAPIGCCWKGWINRSATKVIFNRDEALIS